MYAWRRHGKRSAVRVATKNQERAYQLPSVSWQRKEPKLSQFSQHVFARLRARCDANEMYESLQIGGPSGYWDFHRSDTIRNTTLYMRRENIVNLNKLRMTMLNIE